MSSHELRAFVCVPLRARCNNSSKRAPLEKRLAASCSRPPGHRAANDVSWIASKLQAIPAFEVWHDTFSPRFHASTLSHITYLVLLYFFILRRTDKNFYRTAFWGQSIQIRSSLSPKRDCGSQRVKFTTLPSLEYASCVNLTRSSRCNNRADNCYHWRLGMLNRPDSREGHVRRR